MLVPSIDLKTALRAEPVHVSAPTPPQLFVVVDTEETFDWNAPLSRRNTDVTAMRSLNRLQAVVAPRHVTPTYVVDFPVASQPEGVAPLKELVESGQACIGAHLHPWVNPPHREEVNPRNSFGCQLGQTLETEKIRILRDQIANAFGRQPAVFKAGRYGFGATTAAALESLDFSVDVSVNPRMNFTDEGGPSFDDFDARPFFFGRERRLLEIPCSTDFTGAMGTLAPRVHRAASHRLLKRAHVPGVLSRLHIVDKVMLSPEGATIAEMKALTTSLFRRGVRTFSLTLHSPSLETGCTPYVRTATDLRVLLDAVAAYCDFFMGDLGGVASTPEDFLGSLGGGSHGSSRAPESRQERLT